MHTVASNISWDNDHSMMKEARNTRLDFASQKHVNTNRRNI